MSNVIEFIIDNRDHEGYTQIYCVDDDKFIYHGAYNDADNAIKHHLQVFHSAYIKKVTDNSKSIVEEYLASLKTMTGEQIAEGLEHFANNMVIKGATDQTTHALILESATRLRVFHTLFSAMED